MKTISKILTLSFFIVLFLSCSISEEITFNSDGRISYSYLIDGSNLMKMMPDSVDQINQSKDTLISFANLLNEKKDSISKLSIKEQKKLEALRPIVIKIKMNKNERKKEFFLQISGDFNDSNSLNSALVALNSMNTSRNKTSENIRFLTNTTYNWNGKELIKKSVVSENIKNDSSTQSILTMFTGGKFKTKYNFPKKIKNVNNSLAIISQDGKSVIIEYNASEYLVSPEKTDMKVELYK